MPGVRVLIVDDQADVVLIFREWLEADGCEVSEASDVASARAILATKEFDVVLLDQRLPGSTETEAGLDLIADAKLSGGRVFIVTGHASEEAVKRAFRLGVHDYITKGPMREGMEALIRHKVAVAAQAVKAERAASRTPADRDRLIRDSWRVVRTEAHPQRKGQALEDLVVEIFRTVPGFTVHPNARSADEQIDGVITNDAEAWRAESRYFLFEAKNWSSKVGPDAYDVLMRKLERRGDRARLAFLIAAGGFKRGVKTRAAADRLISRLVILIGPEELESLVEATDRGAVLLDLHRQTVVARG